MYVAFLMKSASHYPVSGLHITPADPIPYTFTIRGDLVVLMYIQEWLEGVQCHGRTLFFPSSRVLLNEAANSKHGQYITACIPADGPECAYAVPPRLKT